MTIKFPPSMEAKIQEHVADHERQLQSVIDMNLATPEATKTSYLKALKEDLHRMHAKLNGAPSGCDRFENAGVDGAQFVAVKRMIERLEV